jgi:phosphoglycerate dehydrogenase-like enzyme
MHAVIRWGRSAYESAEDMAREEELARDLGLSWALRPDPRAPPTSRADVLVVTSKVQVDGPVLDVVRPRLVLTTTSGFEHLDRRACRARGVTAARCPLARRDAVVEHTLSALIRLLRRLPDQEAPAHEGRWARGDLPALAPVGLEGTPIAVVGLGVIGSRVAQVLSGLGARVLGVDPEPPPGAPETMPLDEALETCAAVTLHASSTPSSRGLLDADRLAALPRGCLVVNTARGDLMDPLAAARAVARGHLGGLACDVFPEEPWPHLAQHAGPRILLTPHAAGYTRDLGRRVAVEIRSALRAFVAGEPVPHTLPALPSGPRAQV